MDKQKTLFLSGGVFFFLLEEACLPDGTARDHLIGGVDDHKDPVIMHDFVRAITGINGKEATKDTSLYKECLSEGSVNIPFNEISSISSYDFLVRHRYQEALNRVCSFVQKHFDYNKREWFVKAVIDLIEHDDEIDDTDYFFINQDGLSCSKAVIRKRDIYDLQPFIVGVSHYILVKRHDKNSAGKLTLDILGTKKGQSSRKYTGNLGVGTHEAIKVQLIDFNNSFSDDASSGVTINDEFDTYLTKARDYYSLKKTLLYAEKPHPFYEMFVCNDVVYSKSRIGGLEDSKPEYAIKDSDIRKLESESKYIVIEGTGGIGKTMFLTHLFLSSLEEYYRNGYLPVLMFIKDYKESTVSLVDFIWNAVHAFCPEIKLEQIIYLLERKKVILLLDGLDEIVTTLRRSFDEDLEALVKSYPGNMIVITSRPVSSFVAYARFSLFELQPLSKSQAIEMVNKLDFWDNNSKHDFIMDLENRLYETHKQFASNPLLLTIMLLTYSSFGEIPAKMHVFYSKAFETMARLHDATKGSYRRPLNTGITPEEFVKYFARFCAQTYTTESYEFSESDFLFQMDTAIRKVGIPKNDEHITPLNFLLDLSENLCIMYREGGRVYFIHRSFQEYFTAVYFSSWYDDKMKRVGEFFEQKHYKLLFDRTFDMLYDMAPDKVNRYIIYPFLSDLFSSCQGESDEDTYWNYLERLYPRIYCSEGLVGEFYINEPESYIYGAILSYNSLTPDNAIKNTKWPDQFYELPSTCWVEVFSHFMNPEAYERNPIPKEIPESELEEIQIVPIESVYYKYSEYFGEPEIVGKTVVLNTLDISCKDTKYQELRSFMQSQDFVLYREFLWIKQFTEDLKNSIEQKVSLDDLLDSL